MSTRPPPAPTHVHRACSTCTAPFQHEPVWISDPKASDPEHPRNRTFILCFDGTGDFFDKDISNVAQLTAMLKSDEIDQIVYYQPGIGTYTNSVLKTPAREAAVKLADKMFAHSLGDHIRAGYKYLVEKYKVGDKICIFGFSRGAYTARALAGMLQKVGLLPPSKVGQLKSAYAMYERDDEKGRGLSSQFKRSFCIDVRIAFLGVWDTVESVGVRAESLPFSGSNDAIKVFRHALALDEHRVMFIPTFCTGGKPRDQQTNPTNLETDSEGMIREETDVKEVFFAGVHCDVGGGSVNNGTRNSLARIPLRWMIRECFKAQTGIIFDAYMLKNEVGLDINSIDEAPKPLSSTNSRLSELDISPPTVPRRVFEDEAQEELSDTLSPIHDQMEIPHWKAMEKFNLITKKQRGDINDPDDPEGETLVPNFGQGRVVHRPVMERGLKVHRSVKARILARGADGGEGSYLPRILCWITDEQKPRPLTRDEWLMDMPKHFKWVE